MHDASRPDPDQILKAIESHSRAQRRGELKIFFGSSAGVGKTYAMLQAARTDRANGIDVLVGVVETHGRAETEKMLDGLPLLPRRKINHKGIEVAEFDLEAALKAHPPLILIDELAHTNAPGSRHPKRWQDVEELLDAGIDVYSTLNVQHLEGFNDVITSITGITVHETIPDALFDEADEIQLVDIPTEELLERLHDGKVYIAEGARERAIQNFFNKTNLMSLRELALRRTAEHVDADTDYHRIQAGLFTPNIAGDRVLVCVGQDAIAAKLIRSTRRIASSLKAPWFALAIETTRGSRDGKNYSRQQRALNIAEKAGAKVATVQEEKIGDAILSYARANGVTKIVIGRNIRPPWIDWAFGSLAEYIIRNSGNIDIYVITGQAEKRRTTFMKGGFGSPLNYLVAVAGVALCTGIAFLADPFFEPIDILMIYLLGVATSAIKTGRIPSLVFSILGVSAFNFFFIEPIHTFNVYNSSYWLTFLVMICTSLIISEQAIRLSQQTQMSRKRETQTQTFYALTRELTSKRSRDDVIAVTLRHLQDATGFTPLVWWKIDENELEPVGGDVIGDFLKEEMVAIWACQKGQEAGIGTDTMPSADAYYYPLIGTNTIYGVLSVSRKGGKADLSVDEKALVETFARLLTAALDRVSDAKSAEQLKIDREAERLKNTFLSSMSHDLRSPLSAIKGSAETLFNAGDALEEKVRLRLLQSIRDESARLSRVINNLLDLTRFEAGRISINTQSYFLQEIIGACVTRIADLSRYDLRLDVPSSLPMVNVDGLLIEQVLQNLLDNAMSFSKPGQIISIEAKASYNDIIVEISDHGPGIVAGKEKEIFDKFFTMSQRDRPKGAGLGLAICQAIVTAHGGRIWAENRPGGGASFIFTLPKYIEEAGEAHDPTA